MSLTTRISDLATRIGQEFKARFGPNIGSYGTVMVKESGVTVSGVTGRKVGGLLDLHATVSGVTIPAGGSVVVGTLLTDYRPWSLAYGSLLMSGGSSDGYVRAAGNGELRIYNTSTTDYTTATLHLTYPTS
ncbi:hypothetical protein [Microbacterium karelineae]|uniref:hypothetical protein n=1 Tax=Microbacterium karelineae TaxID=2654283 RepID=UPI0012EAF812|nr:hypothetical protein [Microbacterium karelineae]